MVAKTVTDAIQIASRLSNDGESPCLFLVDLHMPQQDGRSFLQYVGADKRFSGIPTVVLTSSQREHDRQECMHLGAHAYQVKPSNWDDYLQLIDTLTKYWQ